MKCNIEAILKDYKILENEDAKKEIISLGSKKALTFGEGLCIELLRCHEAYCKDYFMAQWRASRAFWPILCKRKNVLNASAVEEILESFPKDSLKGHIKRLFYRIMKDTLKGRKLTNAEYVDSITFPNDYICPKGIRFGKLMEYWLYSHRDTYSRWYIVGNCMVTYNLFRPLHQIPFKNIRPCDILGVVHGKATSTREVAISIYRALDWFAYNLGIIKKCYARDFYIKRSFQYSRCKKCLTREQLQILQTHAGEKNADIALTALYTGLRSYEMLQLKLESLKEDRLEVYNDFSRYSTRTIPLKEQMIPIIRSCIAAMSEIRNRTKNVISQKDILRKMVLRVTNKYLGMAFLPSDLRYTFEQYLFSANVPPAAIEYLRGTNGCLMSRHEEEYRHYSQEAIRSYIERGDFYV